MGALASVSPASQEASTLRPLIAVFGSSTACETDDAYRLAYELGRELGQAGADVMNGGYAGVMEACSRGAREAGAEVVGVTVELFESRSPANPWITRRVHTASLFERLGYLVDHAHGFVTLPGSLGTLTELFLVWTLLAVKARPEAPLVLLGDHWPPILKAHRGRDGIPEPLYDLIRFTADPAEAARIAVSSARRPSPPVAAS